MPSCLFPRALAKGRQFAGFTTFKAVPEPGVYTISLSAGAWVDVIQDGHFVKPSAFSLQWGNRLQWHPKDYEIRDLGEPARSASKRCQGKLDLNCNLAEPALIASGRLSVVGPIGELATRHLEICFREIPLKKVAVLGCIDVGADESERSLVGVTRASGSASGSAWPFCGGSGRSLRA
jgi:hypothetical protein